MIENREIANKINEKHSDLLNSYHTAILQAMIGTNCDLDEAFSLANNGISSDDLDYANNSQKFQNAADDIEEWAGNLSQSQDE